MAQNVKQPGAHETRVGPWASGTVGGDSAGVVGGAGRVEKFVSVQNFLIPLLCKRLTKASY